MKTPIIPHAAGVLATGSVLFMTGLATLRPVRAQDVSPSGLPGLPGVADPAASPSGERDGSRVSRPVDVDSPPPARVGPPRTSRIDRGAGDTSLKVESRLANTILNEEVLGSPQEAVRHYEAVIAEFDSQRANAAQAVFRLAESYRKLGRPEEARIQYARILREFVDFPDLATLSQQQLAQGLPRQQATFVKTLFNDAAPSDPNGLTRSREAATRVAEEERALMHEEIALLEDQLAQTRVLIESGTANTMSLVPLQREILQLKRQLLHRQNIPDVPPQSGAGASNPNAAPASGTPPEPVVPSTGAPAVDPPALQTR